MRLHLTRSAVAKSIGRLESRLGVRLFHRTTRAQSLTVDGQVYYERCVRALDEVRAGQAALESARKDVAGRLRVTAPVLFGRRCAAPLLARLVAEHPALELDISFSDRFVDLVEDGFDLALRIGPVDDGAGLMTRVVGLQRMAVCAAPAYLAARGRPASLAAIADHDAIVYARSGRCRAWRFPAADGTPTDVAPHSRLRFDDLEAIADAAESGHGLAWLPCWLIRDRVRAGRLATVLADVPALVTPIHALWPQSPHLPLRVRLAIDALAAELAAREL